MITINYPNSNTTSFDLKSLYLGCALAADTGVAALPQSCSVAFAGFQGSDNSVANSKQVCAFKAEYLPS
jgi:hypothetical protein